MKNLFFMIFLVLIGCKQTAEKKLVDEFSEYKVLNEVLTDLIHPVELNYDFVPNTLLKDGKLSINDYYKVVKKPIVLTCEPLTNIYFHNYSCMHKIDVDEELISKFIKETKERKKINLQKLYYSNNVEIKNEYNKDVFIKDTTYRYKGYFNFSDIIFNKNRTRGIFYFGFICGPECGTGETIVIDKVNNKWKITKKYTCWIS